MIDILIRKIDSKTGCYFDDLIVTQKDQRLLENFFGEHLEVGDTVDLDAVDYSKLVEILRLEVDQKAEKGELRIYEHGRCIALNSHTGRELLLMLEGKKPLAAFVEVLPHDQEASLIPDAYFSEYCKEGKITRYEYFQEANGQRATFHRVLYALPGEEWRFRAHQMLWMLADKYGWNSSFERVEGFLLGYEIDIDYFTSKKIETLPR